MEEGGGGKSRVVIILKVTSERKRYVVDIEDNKSMHIVRKDSVSPLVSILVLEQGL
jgi:hypothetical protein